MLEGPTENAIPTPISLEKLVKRAPPESAKSSLKKATPLNPDILKQTQDSMNQIVKPESGGEVGTKEMQMAALETVQNKIKMVAFLRDNVGMDAKQYQELPEDLKKDIEGFNPKSPEELDQGFQAILIKLKSASSLKDSQKFALESLKKAIVDEKTLNVQDIFAAIKEKLDGEQNTNLGDRVKAFEELDNLQKNFAQLDPQTNFEKFKDKLPEITKIVGMGGSALMLFAMWRALKDNLSGFSPN